MIVWWKYNVSKTCKIPKKSHLNKITFMTCSHIWHVNMPKCLYWLYTLSVKVWLEYNTSVMNFCYLKSNKFKIYLWFLMHFSGQKADTYEHKTNIFLIYNVSTRNVFSHWINFIRLRHEWSNSEIDYEIN